MPIDPATGAFVPQMQGPAGGATGFPMNVMGIPGVAAGSTPGNLGPLQAQRGGLPQPAGGMGSQMAGQAQQQINPALLNALMGQMGGTGQMGGQAQPGIPTPAQQQLMQGLMSRPPGT